MNTAIFATTEPLESRRHLAFSGVPGAPDDAFGENGVASLDLPGQFRDTAVLPDGRILAIGMRQLGDEFDPPGDLLIARFHADGSIDESFGVNGVVIRDFGGDERGHRLLIRPDGKFYVTAAMDTGFATFRFKAGGGLDKAFAGGDGMLPKYTIQQLLPDGRLLATRGHGQVLARINPGGGRDVSFGGDGEVDLLAETPLSKISGRVNLLVEANGRILLATTGHLDGDAPSFTDAFLLRLSPTGAFDAVPTPEGVAVARDSELPVQDSTIVLAGNQLLWGRDGDVVRVKPADLSDAGPIFRSNSTVDEILTRSNGQLYLMTGSGPFGQSSTLTRLSSSGAVDRRFDLSSPFVQTGGVALLSDGDVVTPVTDFAPALQRLQGDSDDRPIVRYPNGRVIIFGTAGGDTISVSRGAGGIFITKLNGHTQTFSATSRLDYLIYAGDGDDRVELTAPADYSVFLEAGNDRLRAAFEGGGGRGGLGADGGKGNDTLRADITVRRTYSIAGLSGGDGNDLLIGSFGQDHLAGGSGNDTLIGRGQGDYLLGQAGDDVLIQESGRHSIDGGSGRDEIDGVLES